MQKTAVELTAVAVTATGGSPKHSNVSSSVDRNRNLWCTWIFGEGLVFLKGTQSPTVALSLRFRCERKQNNVSIAQYNPTEHYPWFSHAGGKDIGFVCRFRLRAGILSSCVLT
jgi:hypothetical protein